MRMLATVSPDATDQRPPWILLLAMGAVAELREPGAIVMPM